MISPAFHPADLFPCEALTKDVLSHQILMRAVHVGLGLDLVTKITQHLHRSLVGDMRARRVGQPAVAVYGHVLDPVGRQQRRGGGPGRPGTYNQNVGFYLSHRVLLGKVALS